MRGSLSFLLLGLPAAAASRLLGAPDWVTLASAALALVPLARWIAVATGHLMFRVGAGLGGFLNATMANAVELIITVLALRRGLTALVKASITGSIICNTLLTLGLAAFLGGIRYGPQKFAAKSAGRYAAMMILAVFAMALPAFAAANSSTQIAVFVAPLLVLLSLFLQPMDRVFRPIEIVTLSLRPPSSRTSRWMASPTGWRELS